MAEYLVYNKDHWVDVMIAEGHPDVSNLDMDKFATRYTKGDIIQIYEDGICTEPPAPTSPFVIIKCNKQAVDRIYQEAKIVDKTQKELDDEWAEKSEYINAMVDAAFAKDPTINKAEYLAMIKAEEIEETKTTKRREYYFDMSQINTSLTKVIDIDTTQFTNLIKSK